VSAPLGSLRPGSGFLVREGADNHTLPRNRAHFKRPRAGARLDDGMTTPFGGGPDGPGQLAPFGPSLRQEKPEPPERYESADRHSCGAEDEPKMVPWVSMRR
jgi:hypothetical protein